MSATWEEIIKMPWTEARRFIGSTSFRDMQFACRYATETGQTVEYELWGRRVVCHPGDDPHRKYNGDYEGYTP